MVIKKDLEKYTKERINFYALERSTDCLIFLMNVSSEAWMEKRTREAKIRTKTNQN